MKKVLVCGGRDFDDWELLSNKLYEICEKRQWIHQPDDLGNWLPDVTIISGMAKGADTLAIQWADLNWCHTLEFNAEWDKYGSKAGPIRNQQMIDEGHPDLVVAFPTEKSRGTYDMIRRAKKHNIETLIYGSSLRS